jgi:hypothetical protein
MPNEGYKSMREIGKQFGATSHEVGQWLENLGLRTSDHQPTQTARLEGWIAKLPSRQPGTWFYGWDAKRVTELFKQMEYVGRRSIPRPPE